MIRRQQRVARDVEGSYTEPQLVEPAAAPVAAAAPAAPVAVAPVAVHQRFGGGASVAMIGLLAMLFGAWGGIVPYVGPLFGFFGTGYPGWTWNLTHSLLFLVPGAAAVLMGLLTMTQGPSVSHRLPTTLPWFFGLVTALCGAWFVIGPLAWPVLEAGHHVFASASPLLELAYWVGYSLGPGVVLAILGGLTMGISVLNRRDAVNFGTVGIGGHLAARQAA
ncbi:MAG: hypothetical protein ACRD0B_02440 [Acidimicrobiales bacterium]